MVAAQTKSPFRDDRVEKWLTDRGVKFTFVEEFPLGNIDFDSSLRNQARIGTPIINSRIDILTEAFKNGAVFPATVAYIKSNKAVFIDGNHRGVIFRDLKQPTVATYIVDPKTPLGKIQELTYEANNQHGMPNSPEDRLRHAMHMISMGRTQVEAAAIASIPLKDVRKEFGKLEADRRAAAIGIKLNQWRKFSIQSKLRLMAIRNDQVLLQLVNVINNLPLTAQDIGNLVTEINAIRTDVGKLDFIKNDLPVRYRSTDSKVYKRSIRTVYNMQARGLLRAVKEQGSELTQDLSDLDRQELIDLTSDVIVVLDDFLKTL
jgi:hypothetical protein